MELQVVQALGVPGLLFLLAFVFAHIAITEFVKALGTYLKQRRGKDEPFVQGVAVIVLSLALGAVLGAVMLGSVAGVAGIDLPPPFAGLVLGVVLAVIASGYVSWQQRQAAAKGVPADVLVEALSKLQPSVVAVPSPTTWPTAAPPVQQTQPVLPGDVGPGAEGLRPMTPADVQRTRTDWPAVPGLDERGG